MRGTIKKQKDTYNLSSLLSTPIKCTLTLGELLRIRPHIWQDLSKTLNHIRIAGVSWSQVKDLKSTNEHTIQVQLVLLNKIGEYCEGAKGNITLPIEYNNEKTLAILDSGARIAIATKSVWEVWRKLAICKKRLKL